MSRTKARPNSRRKSPRFLARASLVDEIGNTTTLGTAFGESLGMILMGIMEQALVPTTGAVERSGTITLRLEITDTMFEELRIVRILKALDGLIEQHGAVKRILREEGGIWEDVDYKQDPNSFINAYAIQFYDGTVFDKVNGKRLKR